MFLLLIILYLSFSVSEIPNSSNPNQLSSPLPRGTKSFASSRSSLKSPASQESDNYSGSYRRRLHSKKVAVMSDGKFTVESPDTNSTDPSSGIPRRHPLCLETGELIRSYNPEVTTLYESFAKSVQRNANNPFFGTRSKSRDIDGRFCEYRWKTYGQVYEIVKKLT